MDEQKKATCRDCDRLWLGRTREPHEYLVALGPAGPDGTTTYRCRNCDAKPILEGDGKTGRWK